MISSNNPNLERPNVIFQGNTHFDIDTNRFSGKPSYDGHVGGIPLLYDHDKRSLAIDSSDTHTICFGSSGSKKTRALVMPSIKVLGNAGESMIINDSKGELFTRMAGTLEKLGYSIMPQAVSEEIIKIGYSNPLLAMSNIGILEQDKLSLSGHAPYDGFMTGAVKYKPYALLSATSLGGELTLSMCVRGNEEDEKIVSKFFDLMEKNIEIITKRM